MKRIIVCCVAATIFCVSTNYAVARNVENGTVDAVRPHNINGGGVYIKASGANSGNVSCTYPKGGSENWYFITKNNPMMKELLSVALAAKL